MTAAVAMSASFDPLLQNVKQRELIGVGRQPQADYVVLRTDRHTWPLDKTAATDLAGALDEDPNYHERFHSMNDGLFPGKPTESGMTEILMDQVGPALHPRRISLPVFAFAGAPGCPR